jgi:hypothetical protein
VETKPPHDGVDKVWGSIAVAALTRRGAITPAATLIVAGEELKSTII